MGRKSVRSVPVEWSGQFTKQAFNVIGRIAQQDRAVTFDRFDRAERHVERLSANAEESTVVHFKVLGVRRSERDTLSTRRSDIRRFVHFKRNSRYRTTAFCG